MGIFAPTALHDGEGSSIPSRLMAGVLLMLASGKPVLALQLRNPGGVGALH